MRDLCATYMALMRGLLGTYAGLIWDICRTYAGLTRDLWGIYCGIMQYLCRTYAGRMRDLLGTYAGLIGNLCRITQNQPDFDILNSILLFLKESHVFPIKWNVNHMHTTSGNRDSVFSHFLQKIAKKSHILIFWILFCYFWMKVMYSASNGI